MINKTTAELIALLRHKEKWAVSPEQEQEFKQWADRLAELEALLKKLTENMPQDRDGGCWHCGGYYENNGYPEYDGDEPEIMHEQYCPWNKAKQFLQHKEPLPPPPASDTISK